MLFDELRKKASLFGSSKCLFENQTDDNQTEKYVRLERLNYGLDYVRIRCDHGALCGVFRLSVAFLIFMVDQISFSSLQKSSSPSSSILKPSLIVLPH